MKRDRGPTSVMEVFYRSEPPFRVVTVRDVWPKRAVRKRGSRKRLGVHARVLRIPPDTLLRHAAGFRYTKRPFRSPPASLT